MKAKIPGMKNTLNGMSDRLNTKEQEISELEDIAIKTTLILPFSWFYFPQFQLPSVNSSLKIKWKVPKINNSQILNPMPFWAV